MTAVVAVNPKQQFSDANGVPLAGGFVDVYLAGTTTRTNSWQDRGQETLNTNPIELDAAGSCTIWLDPLVSYKIVVKDVNEVVQSHLGGDNIRGVGQTPTEEEISSINNRFYPGVYETDPTVRPDGSAIEEADIHVHGIDNQLYIYTGGEWRPVAYVADSDLESLLLTPTSLYEALADPILPMPAFIEAWAHNSWYSASYATPTDATIPLDSMSQKQLEYTVSGASGAGSLTISAGDTTKGTGQWGAVLQHDDGTYGLYVASGVAPGTVTIFPNLRATTTSKTLRNIGGVTNGQHFTGPGYQALARMVYATTRKNAYRMRYAARWRADFGVKADWTNTGGLGAGQYTMNTASAVISNTANRAHGSFACRGQRAILATPTAPFTGKGITKTFSSLGNMTGFMEMFVSCANITSGANGGFYPFNVTVVADAVTVHNTNYTENDGLVRVLVDLTDVDSVTVTVTRTDETGDSSVGIRIGDVYFWDYDRTEYGFLWTDSVIDKNAKVVVLGDSNGDYYSDLFGTELQAAMTAAGGTGTVTSITTSGDTAENGLEDWSLVEAQNPKQVVILYWTNDHNSYGTAGFARWLTAMYKIGRKCQAIGARPIFMMPLPTQSFGQAVNHGNWTHHIGAGLPNE